MLKKTLLNGAILSTLLFSLGSAWAADTLPGQSMEAGEMNTATGMSHSTMQQTSGEIVGDFNSPDGAVMGATLPGKQVQFTVPMSSGKPQYLHFALMHAASAKAGWYFAPTSDAGIDLSALKFKNHKSLDITQQVGLFQAPDASQSSKVTMDNGPLKYGTSHQFLQVTITPEKGRYEVTIKNISQGEHQTPVSSGVWSVSHQAEKSFDHTPSAALSALATSGHRDALFQTVQGMQNAK